MAYANNDKNLLSWKQVSTVVFNAHKGNFKLVTNLAHPKSNAIIAPMMDASDKAGVFNSSENDWKELNFFSHKQLCGTKIQCV